MERQRQRQRERETGAERDKERIRETERQRERQREREAERETERDIERIRETERQRRRERQRDRETGREREAERDRETEMERHRDRERQREVSSIAIRLPVSTKEDSLSSRPLCPLPLHSLPPVYHEPLVPSQNTGVGGFSLLQGIFPTQGSNWGLLHCRWILSQLSLKGSPRTLEWVAFPFSRGSSRPRDRTGVSCIAGGFFTN